MRNLRNYCGKMKERSISLACCGFNIVDMNTKLTYVQTLLRNIIVKGVLFTETSILISHILSSLRNVVCILVLKSERTHLACLLM